MSVEEINVGQSCPTKAKAKAGRLLDRRLVVARLLALALVAVSLIVLSGLAFGRDGMQCIVPGA